MPTRPRHARKHKNTSSPAAPSLVDRSLSAGSSSSSAAASAPPSANPSVAVTPLSLSPYPGRALQLEAVPQEESKERGELVEEERGEASAWYFRGKEPEPEPEMDERVMEEETMPPPQLPMPQLEDAEEDVLAQLIDFSPFPPGPAALPPAVQSYTADDYDDDDDDDDDVPFEPPAAYRDEYGEATAIEESTVEPGVEEMVYKSPPFMQVALPPEVEDVPVVVEEDEGLGWGKRIASSSSRSRERDQDRTRSGEGHVRVPVVVGRSTSSTSSHTHSRSSSLNPPSLSLDISSSSSSLTSPFPPSLTSTFPPPSPFASTSILASNASAHAHANSGSGSTFGSLSKTIRSYAPSLPSGMKSGLTSPRRASPGLPVGFTPGSSVGFTPGASSVGITTTATAVRKSAPDPPLVSRPLVKGRVESVGSRDDTYGETRRGETTYGETRRGEPRGDVRRQEYEREYERDWDDEVGVGGYGYGYAPPTTTSARTPSRTGSASSRITSRAGSASAVTSRTTSRAASTAAVTVPDRQRAWPEYVSPPPLVAPASTGVLRSTGSRHRATRSQGSQAGLGAALGGGGGGSGLTRTMRGGGGGSMPSTLGYARGVGGSTPSTLGYARGERDEGELLGGAGEEDEVDRVVWARWDVVEAFASGKDGLGGKSERRQVLVVGYERGVQVWDVRDLGSVGEVLNLDISGSSSPLGDPGGDTGGGSGDGSGGSERMEWGMGGREAWVGEGERVSGVVKAVVVPGSASLGILLETLSPQGELGTTLVLYDMEEDKILARWKAEGVPVDVQCSRGVMCMSTSSPPALHILSPTPTLTHLYTIPASALALFSTPRPPSSSSQLSLAMPSSVSPSTGFGLSGGSSGSYYQQQQYPTAASSGYQGQARGRADPREITSAAHRAEHPHPVYALHGRLLAYAIPSSSASSSSAYLTKSLRRKDSSLSSSSGGSGPSPSSVASGSSPLLGSGLTSAFGQGLGFGAGAGIGLGTGVGGIPNTKAELGSAALKVGSGLIGGMRFLGGMALEGVKSRMSAGSSSGGLVSGRVGIVGGTGGAIGGVSGERGVGGGGGAGNGGGMFSKSAPTKDSVVAMGSEEEKKRRRFSDIQHHGVLAPLTAKRGGVSGYGIRVVDLSEVLRSDRVVDASVRGERDLGATMRVGRDLGAAVRLGRDLDATIKDAIPVEDEGRQRHLRVVAEFVGSRSQPIAKLEFTPDGCGVYVVPRDGYVTKVFRILPVPSSHPSLPTSASATAAYPSSSPPTTTPASDVKAGNVMPLYELRRGRVSTAVVESVKGVPDGRWTGVVTRNRTVHIFATNPLGGRSHIPSHLEGRMRNGAPVVPISSQSTQAPSKIVELKPIVRLPGERLGEQESPPPAMAFTFVDASTTLPFSLAPSPSPHHHRGSASNASTSIASTPPAGLSLSASPGSPLSPRATRAPKNYQDVLLFDSATGILYLQRIGVESKLKSDFALGSIGGGIGGAAVGGLVNAAINVSSSLGSRSVSASLPGGGGAGPLGMAGTPSVPSSSVSSHSGVGGRGGAGAPRAGAEEGYELTGKANVVATWDLRKRRGWEEIRWKVGAGEREAQWEGGRGIMGPDECLAQAELSTFSKSRSTRSRPIYLTHQFAFHTLGEDYHALIRKYRLDVHGSKIDVRREIPIHAFGTSAQGGPSSESFVEGFSPTRSSHPSHLGGGVPSSFDEPLASALAGEMEYAPSSNVLPMYPNGPGGGTGGTGRSLRNSIPIRKIGDGVTGGLGRIRRAVPSSVRSPRLGPSRSGGSGMDDVSDVLLEFDEEVDDFMAPRIVTGAGAASGGGSGGMDDDVVGTVDEEIWGDNGWDSQDRMAVEEEEQFHAISGTLSPQFEQEIMLPTSTSTASPSPAGKKKSKKGRK